MTTANNQPGITPQQFRVTLLILGFLIIAGAFLTVFGITFIQEGNESNNWPVAEGKVAGIYVRFDTNDNDTRTYYYEVTYNYSVAGTPYTADRFSLGSGSTASKKFSSDEKARADARDAYPTGSLVLVSYDPDDPSSAVLQPGANWGTYVPLIMGLAFLVGGIALIFLVFKRRRKKKNDQV